MGAVSPNLAVVAVLTGDVPPPEENPVTEATANLRQSALAPEEPGCQRAGYRVDR
jgi:hypothetical protein